MAGFDYSKAQATAANLLSQFGATGTLTKKSGTYDPVAGAVTPAADVETEGKAVRLPSTSSANDFDKKFREDLRKGDAGLFYLEAKALDFAPEIGHLLNLNGDDWEIKGVTTLSPAGVPVIYILGAYPSNQ